MTGQQPSAAGGAARRILAAGAVVVALSWLGLGMARHWDDNRDVPNPVAPSAGAPPGPSTAAAAPHGRPRWYGDGKPWDQSEPARTELVVGDSITGQMGGELTTMARERAQHWEVWAVSGAAPCDFAGSYHARVAAMRPRPARVAFAFVGNVGNRHAGARDCMVSRLWPGRLRSPARLSTGDQARIAALYRADLQALIAWNRARHIETVLVDPPAMRPSTYFAQVNDELVRTYDALARQDGVRSTGLVRETLTPGGVWRQSITTADGTYRLRYTDGTHLAAPYGTQLYATALLAALSAP